MTGVQTCALPIFNSLDSFVLFAQEEIKLEQGVQVSSGALGSNAEIEIEKDAVINGNLFADKIAIDKNTTINGSASFNQLKLHKEAQILGTQTKPVQLPVANLPEVPDFPIGIQDFRFEGQNNTLAAGSYKDVILEKDSRLVLEGGIYNLRKLEFKDGATLIFNAPATLNIQFKLRGHDKISILPGLNLKPGDLKINYVGIKSKNDKEKDLSRAESREDDDDEIESEMDEKEKKEHKAGKIGRPALFGKNSFLNFKLLAPKTKVHIEKESILRGQILARKIKIEKDSVVSRELSGVKIAKQEEIITDPEGGVYPINILLVSLTPDAAFEDALKVAQSINGRIVGNVSSINLYQIEVQTRTIEELEDIINTVRSRTDLKVDGVFRDYLLPIDI